MIDKADFRVPWNVPFTREFEQVMRHADAPTAVGSGSGVWRSSHLYERMGNFEAYGLDVVVHERCKMTKYPNHKLEILKTGEKTLREIRELARRVFHVDEMELGILRADLTADLEDVPVQWFRDHTIVSNKRTVRELGNIPQSDYMTVGKGIAETLYAGVKPNQIRIYDKTGERLERLHRNNLRTAAQNKKNFLENPNAVAVMPTTFQQMFGYDPKRKITRVESQIGGKSLEKIGLLQMHDLNKLHTLHPFQKIRFINDKATLLCREDYTPEEWMAGKYLESEARSHGLTSTKRLMYQQWGNKHFYENWNFYLPFLQNADRLCTYERLQKEYVSSCHQQLYVA